MPMSEVIQRHRHSILELSERHGAKNVRVFGSMARGEERGSSDVDFLVEAGARTTPFFPGGLVMDLQELLGRSVDVVTESAIAPEIRPEILAEAVALSSEAEDA